MKEEMHLVDGQVGARLKGPKRPLGPQAPGHLRSLLGLLGPLLARRPQAASGGECRLVLLELSIPDSGSSRVDTPRFHPILPFKSQPWIETCLPCVWIARRRRTRAAQLLSRPKMAGVVHRSVTARPYPCAPMVVLRADPWAPEYGMGFEPSGEEPAGAVDAAVESENWSRPVTAPEPRGCPVWFVDGVRRVELRLVAEDSGRRAAGLFGSFAVGSVVCDGRAEFGEHHVSRAVVLGGGLIPSHVEVTAGRHPMSFDPATEQSHDHNAPLDGLQRLMREAEANLASRTSLPAGTVALIDGPLHFYEEPGDSVVGVIKRFVRQYLGPDQEALLGRLEPGQRTPVFALLDLAGNPRWYSWYSRIAQLRAPWHDHAGLVRCEVGAGVTPARAVELADLSSGLLPRFAGRAWDPRTPQNLAPVAALEARLRHRMGDTRLIRRALTEWLTRETSTSSAGGR